MLLFVDLALSDVLIELLLRQRHHSVRRPLQQRMAQR